VRLIVEGMQRSVEFCAVLEHRYQNAAGETPSADRVPTIYDRDTGMEIAVLVDIRKNHQHSQQLMEPCPTMVWLQTLDECERVSGNPIRNFEGLPGDGRDLFATLRSIQKQRELTPQVLFGEWADEIPPDEIEKQVVERRLELVKNLSRNYGNIDGRVLGDLQLGCAIRLHDLFVRASATIFGNGFLDGFSVFHGPDDFVPR
jgi:hypothetical protein